MAMKLYYNVLYRFQMVVYNQPSLPLW